MAARWGSVTGPVLLLLFLVLSAAEGHKSKKKRFCYHSRTSNQSIYDFEVKDVHEEHVIDWSEYRGKVMLLSNVASF